MIFPGYAQVVVGPSEFVIGPAKNHLNHVRGQGYLKEAGQNPTSSSSNANQSISKGSVNYSSPLIQQSTQIQKPLMIQSAPDVVLMQSNSTQSTTQKTLQQTSALNFKKLFQY